MLYEDIQKSNQKLKKKIHFQHWRVWNQWCLTVVIDNFRLWWLFDWYRRRCWWWKWSHGSKIFPTLNIALERTLLVWFLVVVIDIDGENEAINWEYWDLIMTMKPYIENIENILPLVVKMKPYIENILSSLLTLEGLQLVWCLVTQSGKRDHCTIGLSYSNTKMFIWDKSLSN